MLYEVITPCGIPDRPVASMTGILGRRVAIQEVVDVVVRYVGALSDTSSQEVQLGAFARGTGTDRYEVDRMVDAGVFSPVIPAEVPLTSYNFV